MKSSWAISLNSSLYAHTALFIFLVIPIIGIDIKQLLLGLLVDSQQLLPGLLVDSADHHPENELFPEGNARGK